MLLEHGAAVDLQNIHGNTALTIAAYNRQAAVVPLLLSAGADTTLRDKDGETAMDLAKEAGASDIVRLLESHRQQQAAEGPLPPTAGANEERM